MKNIVLLRWSEKGATIWFLCICKTSSSQLLLRSFELNHELLVFLPTLFNINIFSFQSVRDIFILNSHALSWYRSKGILVTCMLICLFLGFLGLLLQVFALALNHAIDANS
jgi:hypothetical protein